MHTYCHGGPVHETGGGIAIQQGFAGDTGSETDSRIQGSRYIAYQLVSAAALVYECVPVGTVRECDGSRVGGFVYAYTGRANQTGVIEYNRERIVGLFVVGQLQFSE